MFLLSNSMAVSPNIKHDIVHDMINIKAQVFASNYTKKP